VTRENYTAAAKIVHFILYFLFHYWYWYFKSECCKWKIFEIEISC